MQIYGVCKEVDNKSIPKTPDNAYTDHVKFSNLLINLLYFKEENIMKNVLLDICYREEMLKQFGEEKSLFDLDKTNPIVKKFQELIIGQATKYPKTGPILDLGESNKYRGKLLKEFISISADILYTNEVLANLKNGNVIDAIIWVKKNVERMGGFFVANGYQRIPRDALRVAILSLCSKINE